jgi:hypothetical protein
VAITPDGRLAVGLAAKAFSEAGRGFAYDHDSGETTDLGPHVFARAVNAHGLVAGQDSTTGEVVTFELTSHQIERHGQGLVEGMNDDGVLVGSMSVNTPFFNTTPFFCRPGQAMVDAGALVGPGPLRFASVSDITNDGRMVGDAVVVDPATGEPVTDATGQRQVQPVTASIL